MDQQESSPENERVLARLDDRFFNLSLDPLAVAGFDGFFRRVNHAWSRLLGWSEEELLATSYLSLFHPDDIAANVDEIGRLAKGVDTISYETRLRCRDGSYRWVLGSIRPDVDTGLMYMVIKDIQARREAEETLRGAEESLRVRVALEGLVTNLSTRLLVEPPSGVGDAIRQGLAGLGTELGLDRAYVLKIADTTGVFDLFEQWWADGIEQKATPLLELPREAQRFWMRKLRAAEVVHLPDLEPPPPGGEEAVLAMQADGVRSILFLPLQLRDQTCGFIGFESRTKRYSFPTDAVALMRTVGELVVSAVERAKVESALAATADQLEARNLDLERSNQDLEHFASIVSHDLKSPLQVVRGFVELLGRVAADGPRREESQTYLDAAVRGVERMDQLIEDLLSYAKAGRPPDHLYPVDLATIAEQVVADSAAAIDAAGATVTIGVLPEVLGDATQLRQLLQNLLCNAVKFREPDAVPVVTITAERDGQRWRIVVADNGIGVAPENAERIFGMFSRLHSNDQYVGSGIGLAVCARVAAHHGGALWVEPNPGGGSRFVFTLSASNHRFDGAPIEPASGGR